ncbi:hypothetical protein T492DRAFT_1045225 [Pavlovales sp. CCMP2436]|nr:hypothetical protein T492DRAFT_1045225 [Pavlovales sp. CCMP2436]
MLARLAALGRSQLPRLGAGPSALQVGQRNLSTRRMDTIGLNKGFICKAVIFDLQAVRVEVGETTAQVSAPIELPSKELSLAALGKMLSFELRDAARAAGLDSVGMREVLIERLRDHIEGKAPALDSEIFNEAHENVKYLRGIMPLSAGPAAPAAAAETPRGKYEEKLQALRTKAAAKEGVGGASGARSTGMGWCVQPGATNLSQYLDNRGIPRALLLRPSQALLAEGVPPADELRRTLEGEAAQLISQMTADPFAVVGSDTSSTGLLELCVKLETTPHSVLLLSSSLDLIDVARRAGLLTVYLQKGVATGMRGVDPDFVNTKLEDVVHSVDSLNGVSFRVVQTH